MKGLLDLAAEVQGILVPVAPSTGFRRRLRGDLMVVGQHRLGQPPSFFDRHRKKILFGVAALGSLASLAGLILALLIRSRSGRAAHVA